MSYSNISRSCITCNLLKLCWSLCFNECLQHHTMRYLAISTPIDLKPQDLSNWPSGQPAMILASEPSCGTEFTNGCCFKKSAHLLFKINDSMMVTQLLSRMRCSHFVVENLSSSTPFLDWLVGTLRRTAPKECNQQPAVNSSYVLGSNCLGQDPRYPDIAFRLRNPKNELRFKKNKGSPRR